MRQTCVFLRILALAAILGLLVSGCAPATAPTPGQKPGLKKLVFSAAGMGVAYLQLPVAMRQGFLAEEGFEAEIRVIADEGTDIAALISGDIDFATGGRTSVIVGRTQANLPVRNVAVLSSPQIAYMARPGRFQSIKDLKGRSVGISPALIGRLHVYQTALQLGIDPRTINIINAGSPAERMAGMQNNLYDFGWMDAANVPRAESMGFTIVDWVYKYSTLPLGGLAVADRKVTDQRDEVKRVLRALYKGQLFIKDKANRDRVIEIIMAHSNLDAGLAAKVYDNVYPTFYENLTLDTKAMQAISSAFAQVTEVKPLSTTDVAAAFDFSLLREAIAGVGR